MGQCPVVEICLLSLGTSKVASMARGYMEWGTEKEKLFEFRYAFYFPNL